MSAVEKSCKETTIHLFEDNLQFLEVIPNLYLSNLFTIQWLVDLIDDEKLPASEKDARTIKYRTALHDPLQLLDTENIVILSIGCEINLSQSFRLNDSDKPKKLPEIRSFLTFPDSPSCYLLDLCFHLLPIIYSAIQSQRHVILHCVYGQSRSVTLVIAFLIRYHHFRLTQAIDFIREKKPDISINPSFLTQLYFYEQYCYYESLNKNNCSILENKEMVSSSEERKETDGTSENPGELINETKVIIHGKELLETVGSPETIYSQLKGILRLLQSTYPIYSLPSSSSPSTQLNDGNSSSFIVCDHCQQMISTSDHFISSGLFSAFSSGGNELVERYMDDYWRNYQEPTRYDHQSSKGKGKEKEKVKENKQKAVSSFQSLGERKDSSSYVMNHLQDYYLLNTLPRTLTVGKQKSNATTAIDSTSSSGEVLCCSKCQSVIGRFFPKGLPLFGKYSPLDLYALVKGKCRLRGLR
jgi:hypothetical protein